MRKLVEKLRPASGAASIVSNPFPPPRRSLSPRGPPSPPPPSPSPLKTWPSWRTSRGLFRQLAPADMCQPCVRVCVCVCVCARDLAILSSLLRNPLPSAPSSFRQTTFLPDVFTAAKIKVCATTRGSRRRIGRGTFTLMLSRVLLGAVVDLAVRGIASNSPVQELWI